MFKSTKNNKMKQTYKEDHQLMDLLKITEISRIICDTNMGTLKLRIRKGEKEYRFVLDSVELDKTTNKEIFELLYPPITTDKFYPIFPTKPFNSEQMKELASIVDNGTTVVNVKKVFKGDKDVTNEFFGKKKTKGRPKGSKNINKLTK